MSGYGPARTPCLARHNDAVTAGTDEIAPMSGNVHVVHYDLPMFCDTLLHPSRQPPAGRPISMMEKDGRAERNVIHYERFGAALNSASSAHTE